MSDRPARPEWRHKLGTFLRIANVRLRFILLMIVTGLVAAKWDMLLARWDRWTHPAAPAAVAAAAVEYYCPMHPDVVRSEPGNCPICGMPLSKRERVAAATLPEGVVGRVELSPERLRLAGVATSAVETRALPRRIRAVGTVEVDERSVARIAARVAGRIESLQVDYTGSAVMRGQSLAEIYSPDLVTTEREYLLALAGHAGATGRTHASHGARRATGGDPVLESARARLLLWGMDDDQIAALERAGEPSLRIQVRSPISGTVLEKDVVAGQYVEAGAVLYTVADLSSVWVALQVPEGEGEGLRIGRPVEIASDALPGQKLAGTVSFVSPVVDRDTRTLRARVDVANPGRALRPGMYVDASIDLGEAQGGAALAIPESAVIDTGTRKVVYVQRTGGLFDAVAVELGPLSDGAYPVLGGLAEGDSIVTQGTFLVDAELRLHPGAAASYFGASGSPSRDAAASHAAHPH